MSFGPVSVFHGDSKSRFPVEQYVYSVARIVYELDISVMWAPVVYVPLSVANDPDHEYAQSHPPSWRLPHVTEAADEWASRVFSRAS
jgi:hypothetical protein